jgi:CheY-like chemotaxis protein
VYRILLSRFFEDDNHTLVSAENGQQISDYVKAHSVDAVLMDIQMPVMSVKKAGAEIMGLAKLANEVPIVGITECTMAF